MTGLDRADQPRDEPDEPTPVEIDAARFEREFGESLSEVLDLATWSAGHDFPALYEELDRQIGEAASQEDRVVGALRAEFFDRIEDQARADAPPLAGVHQLGVETVEKLHRNVLFTGEVEACDGTVLVHDSLALTIVQLGVCLVSYNGEEGTWSHRLFRRDLRGSAPSLRDEVVNLLQLRDDRAVGRRRPDGGERLSELGQRGLITYAERTVLARAATAPWRLGHGSPVPYELLTGAGAMDLVVRGLDEVEHLLREHQRFAFVPSAPRHRALLTLGLALRPLEFAVVHTIRSYINDVVERGNLRAQRRERAKRFVNDIGDEVAVGVYRASAAAPPYVFFAPADPELCAQAAAIVLADAVLQEHRGFPLLIDMAHQLCRASFDREDFLGAVGAAYAARGRAYGFLAQRETRP